MIQQYNKIQEEHQLLIEKSRDDNGFNIQLAEDFIEKISRSGEEVWDINERAQLRTFIRYWSGIIFDNTGRFPRFELQPYTQPLENILITENYYQPTSPLDRQQRNRRAMLAKVKAIWIDGLLEQSLAKELRIELDLTEQPNAVDLALNALIQELRRSPLKFPTGTPIINVFDQMGGALLILGAPGAGKTTLLLELARDLIARAEQDEGHPIPVVFNLSSWVQKRRPLKEWLVEELNTKYDVPHKLAQAWMDADVVLPLLDGLDEVAVEQRNDCVEAINAYRLEHGLVPLAVSSRVADYEALATKLRLQGAIVVQPLAQQQVAAYLERAGKKLAGVRAALSDDIELGEMLDTPLMLSIVALAYNDKSLVELQGKGTPDERRRHLFDAYIEAMLRRRSKEVRYTWQETIQWLSWLGEQMVRHNQTVFHIERMQPDWLPRGLQRKYTLLVRLLTGIVVGLFVGLGAGLVGGRGTGLGAGLIVGLGIGLVVGLGAGLVVGLGNRPNYITVIETLRWSWSQVWRGLVVGLLVGLVGGLVVGLGIELVGGLVGRLVGGLVVGLGIGLGIELSGVQLGSEVVVSTTANQGISRSVRSALIVGAISGLVIGLVNGLVGGLVSGPSGGLVSGLAGGLIGGLVGGLRYGGQAVIQHYTLRYLLYRNRSLPLRLVPFLDYCAERIFLRKVGGGYIFVHRLLMEHFAALHRE